MDNVDERRREWKIIHDREEARRRNIGELRRFMEGLGEGRKTAKSLLKLVVYTGGVKASEAADIIGVRRNIIDQWTRMLINKDLVDMESTSHPNPTIKPTKAFLKKLMRRPRQEPAPPPQPLKDKAAKLPVAVGGVIEAKIQPETAFTPTPPPTETEGVGDAKLEPGVTYLLLDDSPEWGVRLFIREIRAGVKGLYLTRSNPQQVRKRHYFGDARVVWLTTVQSEGDVDIISGLQELSILIGNFINGNKRAIILLDGLDYLINNNTFHAVLRMIQQVRDKISTSDSVMLVPIQPGTLEGRELTLLERECQRLR